jgi:membrane protease YdiL (CAAX protease family)
MRDEESKPPWAPAVGVTLAFLALVAVANVVSGAAPASAGTIRGALAGVIFFGGAVALVGVAAPLWLGARGRVALPLWPTRRMGDNAAAVLVVVFLFARAEMLVAIVAEGRPAGAALATFLGAAAVHLAAVTATLGVLLPALKSRMPAAPAAVLAALAWTAYHLLQFHFFPAAQSPGQLFVIGVFGLGYALYYFWSRSLLLTFVLQHLVATTTFVYAGDYAFGRANAFFFLSLAVVAAALVAAVVMRRRYAAERFTYF